MGALHEGHLSLVKKAINESELSVVSIFINKKQFSEGEDFDSYPKSFERDIDMLSDLGLDVLFLPSEKDIYPETFSTHVIVGGLSKILEGVSRPDFFKGVTTVVLKLFNIVRPSLSFFGKKDYQQLLIIKKLVKDLNLSIDIVSCDTVREPCGLAMSSRNNYFPKNSWSELGLIYATLKKSEAFLRKAPNNLTEVKKTIRNSLLGLAHSAPRPFAASEDAAIIIDYIDICDKSTLKSLKSFNKDAIILIAVWVYGVRLIDNLEVSI
tara:strand:- start:244 stop:1041 length:798 start_codon:yes stop_codon:yes gene_type:complete